MSHSWIVNSVLILLNLGALAVLLRGFWEVYQAWQTTHWKTVPGQLTTAEIEKTEHKSSKNRRQVYQVKAQYQYDVYGKTHVGETIATSYIPSSELEEHQELLDWLNHAGSVQVFYDPLRPQQSVLVPGIDRGSFSMVSIGVLCLAITGGLTGMYCLIYGNDPSLVQNIVML